MRLKSTHVLLVIGASVSVPLSNLAGCSSPLSGVSQDGGASGTTPVGTPAGTGMPVGTPSGTATGPPSSDGSAAQGGAMMTDDGGLGAAEAGITTGGPDAASTGDAGGAVQGPPGCVIQEHATIGGKPAVSFKTDIQPFLASSCGQTAGANAGNGGCHVLDASSTVASGGYDHAYDWITDVAHTSSCPEVPTPFRFQVIMAVVQESDPASCSKCDKMPLATTPARAPLTACQQATLQSWLDEPYVVEMHRTEGDPDALTTPYAMPPFN